MITMIGSHAMKHHFPDYRQRPKPDTDFQVTTADEKRRMDAYAEANGIQRDVFYNPALALWNWAPGVASPEELYTMKVSHSFWEIGGSSRNWQKHMDDIVFLQRKGVEFVRPLYDILYPMHKEMHGNKRTSLKQNAMNFFGDGVKRKYDHDSIHNSVAHAPGKPLFEEILMPGEDVMVDSAKFWAMDRETQFKLVSEEIAATALERILIPSGYKGSPTAAWAWSVRRVITSLFKGEWALFLVLNYDYFARPTYDYLGQHLNNKGLLVPLK